MDCVNKQDTNEMLVKALSQLSEIDAYLSEYFNNTPGYTLNPSVAFMSSWNKVKAAKALLHSINLDDDEVTT